jgi:hypothetical protein
MYTADPSAHVWKDGRLYVYASHDIAPPRGCDLMDQYHVFSTDDMVHWKDHGEILRASQVPWGRKEGGFMWAPDCAYKNGTYYFYFPHPTGSGAQQVADGFVEIFESTAHTIFKQAEVQPQVDLPGSFPGQIRIGHLAKIYARVLGITEHVIIAGFIIGECTASYITVTCRTIAGT